PDSVQQPTRLSGQSLDRTFLPCSESEMNSFRGTRKLTTRSSIVRLAPMNSHSRAGWTAILILLFLPAIVLAQPERNGGERDFYLPADPKYSIFDSVRDSVSFTLGGTLKQDVCGHLVSMSSFVNPDGQSMHWHDFGDLEGPGWAANAVGGAGEIYRMG